MRVFENGVMEARIKLASGSINEKMGLYSQ